MNATSNDGYGKRWLDASLEERRTHFRDIFVTHPQLNECLRMTATLCETRRFTDKGVGLLIRGRPGGGKTTFIKYLRRRYARKDVPEGAEVPFVDITVPRSATPLNLVLSIMRALGDPLGRRPTLDIALSRVTALLMACRTKMIAVDNVQDIPEAHRERGLQRIGNTLREICDAGPVLMLLGTDESDVVVATNDQLKSRVTVDCQLAEFDVSTPVGMSRFLKLIDQFELALPLPECSGIAETAAGKALALAADGAIGYLARLMSHATYVCLERGGARLSAADLERSYLATFGLTAAYCNPFATSFTALRRLNEPGEPHYKTPKQLMRGRRLG